MREKSVWFFVVIGLIVGAIIHIMTILFAARLARMDTWSRAAENLSEFMPMAARLGMANDQISSLEAARNPARDAAENHNDKMPDFASLSDFVTLSGLDPLFDHAICRFHLRAGPVHIYTQQPVGFWTANLFRFGGISFFSINMQLNAGKPLNLLVATSDQLASLRLNNPTALRELTVVETAYMDGALLLRAYQRYEQALPNSSAEMADIVFCGPYQGNLTGSGADADTDSDIDPEAE